MSFVENDLKRHEQVRTVLERSLRCHAVIRGWDRPAYQLAKDVQHQTKEPVLMRNSTFASSGIPTDPPLIRVSTKNVEYLHAVRAGRVPRWGPTLPRKHSDFPLHPWSQKPDEAWGRSDLKRPGDCYFRRRSLLLATKLPACNS